MDNIGPIPKLGESGERTIAGSADRGGKNAKLRRTGRFPFRTGCRTVSAGAVFAIVVVLSLVGVVSVPSASHVASSLSTGASRSLPGPSVRRPHLAVSSFQQRAASGGATTTITFNETGLRAGTFWSVWVNSTAFFGNKYENGSVLPYLQFFVPNGNYTYAVDPLAGYYVTSGGSGTLNVTGAPISPILVTFVSAPYTVTFQESGLPNGAPWWVKLAGKYNLTSTNSNLSFPRTNGTYGFQDGTLISGYVSLTPRGAVNVQGKNVVVPLTFAPAYPLQFTESGLPAGTRWSVSVPRLYVANSTGSTISYLAPNGSYSFSVPPVSGYVPQPSSGSLVVRGSAVSQSITFTSAPGGEFAVSFVERGLPSGTNWSVTFHGTSQSASAPGTITFYAANGTYPFIVGNQAGYLIIPASGTVTVQGAAVTQTVTFALIPPGAYPVTFTETGLPSGTNWSVSVLGFPLYSITNTIVTALPNGTYQVTYQTQAAYTPSPSSVSVTVSGRAVFENVTFSPTTPPSPSTPGFLGLPGALGYYLLTGIAVVIVAGVGVALWTRSRVRRPPNPPS